MGGYTRAGWYSYDTFDNTIAPSTDRIIQRLQHLKVDDVMPTNLDGGEFEVTPLSLRRILEICKWRRELHKIYRFVDWERKSMSKINDSGKSAKKRGKSRTAGYVGAVIVNLILLFIFNNLLNLGVPFLTEEFVVPLRILNIIGVVVVYTFYATFPFDFSPLASEELVTTIVRILLILGLVGAAIGIVAEFSKFIKATIWTYRS